MENIMHNISEGVRTKIRGNAQMVAERNIEVLDINIISNNIADNIDDRVWFEIKSRIEWVILGQNNK